MFETGESRLEKIGRIMGFGFAMLIFTSALYYVLSRFIEALSLGLYFIAIPLILAVYAIVLLIRGLRNG